MSQQEKTKLAMIYNALDQLEVKGEKNLSILLGCMSEIKKITEQEASADEIHPTPKS